MNGVLYEKYTCSEQFRHECELNMIMKKKTREERRFYIDCVERIRGVESANRIRNDLLRLWKRK